MVVVIVKLGCATRGSRNGFAKSLEPAGGGRESDSSSLSFDLGRDLRSFFNGDSLLRFAPIHESPSKSASSEKCNECSFATEDVSLSRAVLSS